MRSKEVKAMGADAGQIRAVSPEANALASDCVDTGMMVANNIWWSDDRLTFVGIDDPDYARDPVRIDPIEAPVP
jgi:hypothetical protein